MTTSVQAPRISGGKTAAEAERDDLRDLLAAVLEALDLPPSPERPALLDGRVLLVLGTVRDVVDGRVRVQYLPFETETLRQKTAQGGAS